MNIRIDKLLSELQIASRSESKKLAKQGQIILNGSPVKSADVKIDTETDDLQVNGKPVIYEPFQYIMFHKPAGCITATEDSRDKTVMDYLPGNLHRGLAPVGRLDKDTEGLLLITDDGALNHNLLSPKKHVPKTYYARVLGIVTEETSLAFSDGVDIGEKEKTAPAILKILSSGIASEDSHEISEIELTITEGKFHQVKRMFEAVDMKVLYLKRLTMGSLILDKALAPGEWRFLTKEELTALKDPQNGFKSNCM